MVDPVERLHPNVGVCEMSWVRCALGEICVVVSELLVDPEQVGFGTVHMI